MGRWLTQNGHERAESIVLEAFRREVPIFVPAFSDCSAGFGLIAHQAAREDAPHLTIDSVKDFHELSKLKIHSGDTGF
jgi:deoxyhypusine synthase